MRLWEVQMNNRSSLTKTFADSFKFHFWHFVTPLPTCTLCSLRLIRILFRRIESTTESRKKAYELNPNVYACTVCSRPYTRSHSPYSMAHPSTFIYTYVCAVHWTRSGGVWNSLLLAVQLDWEWKYMEMVQFIRDHHQQLQATPRTLARTSIYECRLPYNVAVWTGCKQPYSNNKWQTNILPSPRCLPTLLP